MKKPPLATVFEAMGLHFTLYTFEEPGDELVLHRHEYDHLSVVTNGTVEVFGPEKSVQVEAPQSIMFRANKDHGVRALTAKSTILNVAARSGDATES